jgi:hypothetical protein
MIKFSYLEYIKILPQNNKQAGKPMVKWTRYLKKHFTRDDSKWSININMCSNSIAIRESKLKLLCGVVHQLGKQKWKANQTILGKDVEQ